MLLHFYLPQNNCFKYFIHTFKWKITIYSELNTEKGATDS